MPPTPLTHKRPLGHTGITVPPIGFGAAWIGFTDPKIDVGDQQAIATTLAALESGINLIDTSPHYQDSERRLGLAFDRWYRNGGRREDIVLTTKTGSRVKPRDYSGKHTRESVEESLRLLKTDYIDVLLIHDIDADGDRTFGRAAEPGAALDMLEELKSKGVIRAIGLGCRDHKVHRDGIDSGRLDMTLTFYDHHLVSDDSAYRDIIEPAHARGMGVFAAMVLMYGMLTGEDPREAVKRRGITVPQRDLQLACDVRAWAISRDIPMLALALQYCTNDPRISSTLVGATSPEHIASDVRAVEHPVSDNDWRELNAKFGIPVRWLQ